MIFASDNWAGVHPVIARRLSEEGDGVSAAYGSSDLDKRIEEKFNQLFEREVAVFFVATGTAANSLALASVNRNQACAMGKKFWRTTFVFNHVRFPMAKGNAAWFRLTAKVAKSIQTT